MMSRYIGRATGIRRKAKHFPKWWVFGIGTAVCGLILIGVLIMNPGADRPGTEKGSASPSLVMPDTTPPPTSPGHKRHHH